MARTNQIPSCNQYRKPRIIINNKGNLSISERERKRVRDINESIRPVGKIDGWFPDIKCAEVITQDMAANYDFIDWLIISHENSGGKIGDADVVDFLKNALIESTSKGESNNGQQAQDCKESS